MEIRRAADRATSHEPGIVGRHCFSWGDYYDPANVSVGPLVAANIFDLEPGAGFDPHPHAGVAIVTWVAQGELLHTDSGGRSARLSAGSAAVLQSGDGVEHAERNEGASSTRIVQLFLHPGSPGPPQYRVTLRSSMSGAGFSRTRSGALWTGMPGASLSYLEQSPHEVADLPEAAGLWALVLEGSVDVDGASLQVGDEVRARPGPRHLQAGGSGAQVLLVTLD